MSEANGQRREDRHRLVVVVALIAVFLGVGAVRIRLPPGWVLAYVNTFLPTLLLWAYILFKRDAFLAKVYLLGILVGFGELPTDAWNVEAIRTLVYAPHGLFLWDSPLYMPFSWALMFVQVGYVSHYVAKRFGMGRAIAAAVVLGGTMVPVFELLAHLAHTWHYRSCWMLLAAVPCYVILSEALIFAPLPLMIGAGEKRPWIVTVLLGAAESAWVFAASWIAFRLVGRAPG